MRPGLRDTGWVGSLFDEPIAPSKPVLTKLQFPATGPFPDDKGELVHYAHETRRKFELNGHMVEEFVSTDRPIAPASEMGADMAAVDAARAAGGNLPRARCSVENGIRTYEDPALQEIEHTPSDPVMPKTLALLRNERGELYCNNQGMIVDEQECHKCGYVSEIDTCRWAMSVHDAELVNGKFPLTAFSAMLAKPKKPAKEKKAKCLGTPSDVAGCKECALNKFWKWRGFCEIERNVCNVPTVLAKPEPVPDVKPVKEPMALLLNGKWYSEGKLLWDCSDCLCHVCANNGKSCHDCKGFEYCMKHGGKIGNCPDFRTEEGKEQHCLENGCLCFTCQRIGEQCEDCPGPIRCEKPRMKCKEYIGAAAEEATH